MFNTYDDEHQVINDNDINNCKAKYHKCSCYWLIRGY